ncbi:conserved hypothetical protein [gamma proteobacterium HdN1]|nr:conserved hypothetical protein [gamma proteobacterium HdN1]
MSYEYGSLDLGIRNPFRAEGFVRAVSGVLTGGLGLFSLLMVKSLVDHGDRLQGWLHLLVGVVLLAAGLAALGTGIFQMIRFFVGRSVPTSLARNVAKSEVHVQESGIAYQADQVGQMLQGRKNLTFVEPQGWLARLIHSLFPTLLFMPYLYRNMTQRLLSGIAATLLLLVCYGLAWFSGSTGLTSVNNTPVMDWMGLVLALLLFGVWYHRRAPISRNLQIRTEASSLKGIVIAVAVAIAAPILLSLIHYKIYALPKLPVSGGPLIALIIGMALVVSAFFGLMLFIRMQKVKPITEVSELRANWQESIHPQEIFINFENIVMANRRYREVPNRVYRDFDANLIKEGGADKGHFSGEMIQETQPAVHELELPSEFRWIRMAATVVGNLFVVAAAFWLYAKIGDLSHLLGGKSAQVAQYAAFAESLLRVLTVWMFGVMLIRYTHFFWGELQFDSLLVYFRCEGTYSESRLSTGTSIYDSTRSENTVVRSSMTPWVLATQVRSVTFAESGARNLEYPRHVLEMHKADDTLRQIEAELHGFLRDRETLASINNQRDLASAARIHQVNQQTRAVSPQSLPEPEPTPRVARQPQIPPEEPSQF